MELSEDQMAWLILGLVHDRGHVSFAEIDRFVDLKKGDESFFLPNFENLVVWFSLTTKCANAIERLIREKKVFIHPSSELSYIADGAIPSMPKAKSIRNYTKPHWVPCCLHHTEIKE